MDAARELSRKLRSLGERAIALADKLDRSSDDDAPKGIAPDYALGKFGELLHLLEGFLRRR